MDRRRLFGGALALALAGATVASVPTTAATTGTGSSTLSTELLSIEIGEGGELLGISLIGEEATTTNGASPNAVARLRTASVGSDVVSLLNVAGPTVEVASSSSPQTVTAPAVDLGAPAGQTLPAGVVAGQIVPKPLSASVDAAGAHASGGASLEGLSLAGGLISSGTVATVIGSDSVSTDSSSARTVVAENLRVLDLGALLKGLGIDPSQLSLDTLSKLIASLDLDVAGVPVSETLAGTVNDLSGQIETLADLLATTGALSAQQITVPEVPGTGTPVDPVVDTVVDTVDDSLAVVPVPDVPLDTTLDTSVLPDDLEALLGGATSVQDVLDLIENLQGELQGVLDASLDALEAAPLLTVDSVEITVASKATDAVETSLADVTAKISGVHVGELGSLGGIDVTDLTAPTSIAAVDALVATIEAEVAAVLTLVDPGLAGMVDVSLFEETESVSLEGTTVKALAQLTAVTASVTPPSDLAGIIDGILAEVGLADLLAGAGLEVPTVEGAMTQLNSVLTGVTAGGVTAQQVPALGALADGVVVRLGTLVASSSFTPAAASVPTPSNPGSPSAPTPTDSGNPGAPTELPRTGSSLTFVLLAFAALLIATGLGLPQWAEAAVTSRGSRHTN